MTVFTSNISESNSGGNITLDHLVDATAGVSVTGGNVTINPGYLVQGTTTSAAAAGTGVLLNGHIRAYGNETDFPEDSISNPQPFQIISAPTASSTKSVKLSLNASGSAYFEGLTEHASGVKVTGGTTAGVVTGLSADANTLEINLNSAVAVEIGTSGTRFQAEDLTSTFPSHVRTFGKLPSGTATSGYSGFIFNTGTEDTGSYGAFSGFRIEGNQVGASKPTEFRGFSMNTDISTYATNIVIGYESTVDNNASVGTSYNFYASGDAPNYFAGLTEHASGVKVEGGDATSVENGLWHNSNGLAGGSKTSGTDVYGLSLAHIGDGNAIGIASALRIKRGGGNGSSRPDYRGIYIDEEVTTSTAGNATYGIYSDLRDDVDGDNYNFYAAGTAPNYFAGTVSIPSGSTVGGSSITSDGRYKENISAAASQLDDVKALAALLVNYDWTDDSPIGEDLKANRFLGLVAQDVEEVCPGLVGETQMPGNQVLRTPEQTIPAVYGTNEDGDEYIVEESYVQKAQYGRPVVELKTLKLDAIQMKMLGAIGDLIAKNEELEARLDAAGV